MFAPPVAKPKTKAAASSNNTLALERSALAGQRFGDRAFEQQASLTGNEPGAHAQEADAAAAREAAPGPSWNLSKITIFPPGGTNQPQHPFPFGGSRLPGPVQAKLKVGAVDDPLEHEADRVADQVMRMPAPETSIAAAPPQVSRKCDACEEKEKLQKKPAGPQAAAGDAPAIVHEVLRSPGQPLDAATRGFMEPRFGQDFSGVRVHTDAAAGRSAQDVNAYAYTVGPNMVFDAGRFAPGTHDGQRLIAHELTHVVQQTAPNPIRRTSDPLLQREPRHGQAGPREATVDVRWSADEDRFYDRVVAALGRSPSFRGIHPDRFNSASDTGSVPEYTLRALVGSFESSYYSFYHRHPKEGETVKLHVSAYYDPHADFALTNKKISIVEPPPSGKAPARAEEHGEHLPTEREKPEPLEHAMGIITLNGATKDCCGGSVTITWLEPPKSGVPDALRILELIWGDILYRVPDRYPADDSGFMHFERSPGGKWFLNWAYHWPSRLKSGQPPPEPMESKEDECDPSDANYGECLVLQRREAYQEAILEAGELADAYYNPFSGGGGGVPLVGPLGHIPNLKKGLEVANTARKLRGKRIKVPQVLEAVRTLASTGAKLDEDIKSLVLGYRSSSGGSTHAAFNRNFAAARVRLETGETAIIRALNVAGGTHSEEEILEVLTSKVKETGIKLKVEQIFSERVPCVTCWHEIVKKHFGYDVDIFYFIGYTEDRASELRKLYY